MIGKKILGRITVPTEDFIEKPVLENKRLEAFVKMFGMDLHFNGRITYENGLANTPNYVGDKLTKQEVHNRLSETGLVSNNLLGRIMTSALLLGVKLSEHPSSEWYRFEKLQNGEGETNYRLERHFSVY